MTVLSLLILNNIEKTIYTQGLDYIILFNLLLLYLFPYVVNY